MLGIRHYKKTAVDLWQGDSRFFVSDFAIAVPPEWARADFAAGLAKAPARSHVVLTFSGNLANEPQRIMGFLKDTLDQEEGARLRRITFVLNSLEQYQGYQQALFAVFPDFEAGV